MFAYYYVRPNTAMCPLTTMGPHTTTTYVVRMASDLPRNLQFVADVNFNARILLYVSSILLHCGAQGGGEQPGTLPPHQRHATSTSAHTDYTPGQAAANYSREFQSGEPEPPRDYDLRRREVVRVLCRIDSLETSCLLGLPLFFSFVHVSFGLAELTHVMPLTKALLSPRSRSIFFFPHFNGAV
jgi:hypothetical protein